jgi:hypothetical protein
MKALTVWTFAAAAGLALVLGTTTGAPFAQTKDPVVGKWTMNIAKSKLSPGPPPKSAAIVFSGASGADGIKAVFDGVTDTGEKVHWEYTANHDGKDYPMTGNPDGDTIVLKRLNANSVETTYKKGGKVTVTNVRTVSADGKTMTVTTKGTNAQGQAVNNTLVFEKS